MIAGEQCCPAAHYLIEESLERMIGSHLVILASEIEAVNLI